LIAGLVLFSLVNCDGAYDVFWQSVDSLIMDSLTHNPAGMKLNEPVNTALASFFQYHIHLWKSKYFVENYSCMELYRL
uniref:Pecanex-like protein n=1 Tax=Haemonchus placei TaxID=6290 RepID=A0A0N4WY40_HAEPC